MAKETAAKVMKKMEENDIHFVKLWFTDILGFLKSFSVPFDEWRRLSTKDRFRWIVHRRVRPDR